MEILQKLPVGARRFLLDFFRQKLPKNFLLSKPGSRLFPAQMGEKFSRQKPVSQGQILVSFWEMSVVSVVSVLKK